MCIKKEASQKAGNISSPTRSRTNLIMAGNYIRKWGIQFYHNIRTSERKKTGNHQ